MKYGNLEWQTPKSAYRNRCVFSFVSRNRMFKNYSNIDPVGIKFKIKGGKV
jgi:hypothetical protein